MYTTIIATDIVGYARQARTEDLQSVLRARAYQQLAAAFAMTQIPWDQCQTEDRGDGALIIVPATVDCDYCLDPLVHHLAVALRRYNRHASEATRLRLRLAIHFGHVQRDSRGVSGHAATHLFRLIEASAFKRALRNVGTDLGVLISDQLHNEAIQRGGMFNPSAYQPIRVSIKETRCTAWLWLAPRA
ncbi:hypothetical protein [Actinomadura chokoriensis]|uniref:Guanylate cyclase domain-containing protein n=1 Tax=Actinomadura chokoriensis TaxID=454156 RepID=A0ABV4R7D7_9ACTN